MNVRQNVYWSKEVKIITIIVTAILLFAVPNLIKNIGVLSSLALTLIMVTFAVCILNAPLYVTIDKSRFILKKVLGKVVIKYDDITEVDLYASKYGSIRLLGSGGFFGYLGIFSAPPLGKYVAYIGDRKQTFFIKTQKGKTYVFSCENTVSVVETIKNNTP